MNCRMDFSLALLKPLLLGLFGDGGAGSPYRIQTDTRSMLAFAVAEVAGA